MKESKKKWFGVLIVILAIITPVINRFLKYGDFISLLIIIIALNSTYELRQDFKKYWDKHRKLNIILFAIVLGCLISEIFLF